MVTLKKSKKVYFLKFLFLELNKHFLNNILHDNSHMLKKKQVSILTIFVVEHQSSILSYNSSFVKVKRSWNDISDNNCFAVMVLINGNCFKNNSWVESQVSNGKSLFSYSKVNWKENSPKGFQRTFKLEEEFSEK